MKPVQPALLDGSVLGDTGRGWGPRLVKALPRAKCVSVPLQKEALLAVAIVQGGGGTQRRRQRRTAWPGVQAAAAQAAVVRWYTPPALAVCCGQ